MTEMSKLLALLALAILIAFLGILAFKVPSPDLVFVVVLTLALAGYDVVTSAFRRDD
jgi:hypothetical protein